jgi:hypothetical protein
MNADQLTVPQLAPRVRLVLQGACVIRCMLLEELVKQPARQNPKPRRRGRRP